MKVADLRPGGLYAARDYGCAIQVGCLDPTPAWANRPLAAKANGMVWSLPGTWDAAMAAAELVVEPHDIRRHAHKRGWPLFVVPYTCGRQTLLIPRAIYTGYLRPWDDYVADEQRRRAREAASVAQAKTPQALVERRRRDAEMRKIEQRQLVAHQQAERRAQSVVGILEHLGVKATVRWDHRGAPGSWRWLPSVVVPVEDMRRLLALIAEDEMALAVLAGA